MSIVRTYANLHARLMANAKVDPDSGCVLWQLRAHGRKGNKYPRLNVFVRGRIQMIAAHRAVLVIDECGQDAPIEEFWDLYLAYSVAGFEADHAQTCVSPLCINRNHLQWLPREDHLAETKARGQGVYGFPGGKRSVA
jgi:hypothetical protein